MAIVENILDEEQAIALKRRQKAEMILDEIYDNIVSNIPCDVAAGTTDYHRYRVNGLIGKNIKIEGGYVFAKEPGKDTDESAEYCLTNSVMKDGKPHEQILLSVVTQNQISGLRPRGLPKINDATRISLFSPAWKEYNGETTANWVQDGNEAVRQVLFYLAPEENPDQLLDNLGMLFERSKRQAPVKKLSEFILPNKAADLVRAGDMHGIDLIV